MIQHFLFAVAVLAGVGGAAPAAAQAHVQSAQEALAQDAADYAGRQGVPVDEAERRLRAEADTVALTGELEASFRDRLAGISIQHQPDFRIRVLLTGDAPVAPRRFEAGGMVVPIEFAIGAVATRTQAVRAIAVHQAEMRRRMPGAEGVGYDQRTGEIVVMLARSNLAGHAEADVVASLRAALGVPVRLRILGGSNDRNAGAEGGSRVEGDSEGRRLFCTTGFIVTDGARKGVITAAHCPDTLTYYAPGGAELPLAFVGQWGAQFQDVQVNVGAIGEAPLFYVDRPRSQARAVTQARLRSATRAGETVCHRGEASGYSCAQVDLTDYAPPGDLCGGPCHPVWTTVSGPGCHGGDSGGPVFAGTVALGILKGSNYAADGRCNFYYYMSTDYLPPGWSLLTTASVVGGASPVTASRTGSPDPASP